MNTLIQAIRSLTLLDAAFATYFALGALSLFVGAYNLLRRNQA